MTLDFRRKPQSSPKLARPAWFWRWQKLITTQLEIKKPTRSKLLQPQKPKPAWMSFLAGVLLLGLVANYFSLTRPSAALGAYTTSTTDADGVAHLGSNGVNDTFFYDTTKDSDPATQQQLGVDPNWRQGITRKSYALSYDGSSDLANVAYSASLNITSAITLEAWIKTTRTARADIVTRYLNSGAYPGYGLSLSPSGCSAGQVGMWVGGASWACSTGTANDGNWHHVAATFDGTTIRFFIDGATSGTAARSNGLSETATALKIGSNPGSTDLFLGQIDEVRISSTVRYVSSFTSSRRLTEDTQTRALWHFDEGSGQAFADSSPNNNDGTPGANSSEASDDPTWVTGANAIMDGFDSSKTTGGNRTGAGNISLGESSSVTTDKAYDVRITNSNALSFDGGDFVTITDSTSLAVTSAITVEGWIKFTSLGTAVPIFNRRTAGNVGGVSLETDTADNTKFVFWVYSGGSWRSASTTTGAISANTWHHVAGTFDGSTIRVFVDGTLLGSTSHSGTINDPSSPSVTLGSNIQGSQKLVGLLDEVRVSNSARYSQSFSPLRRYSTDANTVAIWHLDEGSGQSLTDSSGNGNSGTLGADGSIASDDPTWDEGIGASQNSVQTAPTKTSGEQIANSSAGWALPGYQNRQRLNIATTTAISANHGVETTIDRATLINNKQMRPDGKDTRIVHQPSDQFRSLSFDNSNDLVTIPANTGFNSIASNITVEAWVKLTAYAADAGHDNILSNDKIYFNLGDGGKPAIYMIGLSNPGWHTATNPIPLGQWTHLAATYNGSTVKIYQNGIEIVSASATGSITASTTSLLIGKRSDVADSFNGAIDEVRISNSIRYTGNFTPLRVPFSSDSTTKGLWHLDEASGQTVVDSSSLEANGFLGADTGFSSDDPTWLTGTTADGAITTTQEIPRFIPHGNTLNFDGSNDIVTISGWGTTITQPFTWEAWVKPASGGAGNYDMILRFNTGSSNSQAGLWYDPANQKFVYGTHGYYTATSSSTFTAGSWYHVAGVHDASRSYLYVNGNLEASTLSPSGPENTGMTILQIGNDTSNQGFLGQIDEVRLSNTLRYRDNFTPSTNPFARDFSTLALYHFDEGTGQTITDSSSNGYNGTLGANSGSNPDDPTWVTNGGYVDSTNQTQFKVVSPVGSSTTSKDYYLYYGNLNETGSAQSYTSYSPLLDGTNDYITVADSASLDVTSTFTFTAWINATTFSGTDSRIIDKITANVTDGYLFDVFSSELRVCTTSCVTGTTTLSAGTSYFVAAVLSGGTLTLYLNGTSDGSGALANAPTNALSLQFGRASDGTQRFNGQLDDIRIYNRALDSGEISRLNSNAPTVSNSGLVGHWKLNDSIAGGTTAADSAGSNTGTLTNFDFNASSNWQVKKNLLGVATEPTQSSLVTETETPIFYQYRDAVWSGGSISNGSWSTRAVLPITETQLGATGVHVKFNPLGLYSRHDYYRITSWAIEAFSSSAPARGKSNSFPEKANIVGDNAGVTIIDASTNKVWMRFANGYNNMIDGNAGSGYDYVAARDGQLFVAAGAYVPVGMISFDRDLAHEFSDAGNANYKGFIADRSDSLEYATSSGAIVSHATRTKLSIQIISNKMYVASAGSAGVNVIHNITSFDPNSRTGTIVRYGTDTWHAYADTELTSTGTLYGVNFTTAPDQLEKWTSVQNDTSDQINAADRTWTPSSTPALRSADINDISVTSGTSTADNGTSDTIAIAHASGVDVIQDHSTQSSGTVRYYTKTGTVGSSSWNAKKFGGAIDLDGSSDYAAFSDNNSLDITSTFTLEAWVRLDTMPSGGSVARLMAKETAGGAAVASSYGFGIIGTGKLRFTIFDVADIDDTGSTTISAGSWYHVAVSKTGTSYHFFINGTLNSTITNGNSPTANTATLLVGRRGPAATPEYVDGVVDEIRISNTARYTANFTVPSEPFTYDANTSALFHLDEITGQTIYDDSTQMMSGTLGANSSAGSDDPLLIAPVLAGSGTKAKAVGLMKNADPGNMLTFDGSNDYVSIPHHSSYDPGANGLSLSFYTKSSAAAEGSILITNGTHLSWYLQVSGTKLYAYFSALSTAITSNAVVINDNTWHHVVVTWNGTKFQLYVDGVLDTTQSPTGTANGSSNPLRIGSLVDTQYFAGNIADVRVFNRGLSGTEANRLYNGDTSITSGLVGGFGLKEGTGQVVGDSSGTANPGTLGASSSIASDDPTWSSGAPIKNKTIMWVGTNDTGANDGGLTAINLGNNKPITTIESTVSGLPDLDIESLSVGSGGLALVGTEAGAWNPGTAGVVVTDLASTTATAVNPVRVKSGTTRIKSGGTVRIAPKSE